MLTRDPHLVRFFFNDTATTDIYTLSLHDALPISSATTRPAARTTARSHSSAANGRSCVVTSMVRSIAPRTMLVTTQDRKSTRLNSSHANISYAVFCLKKQHDATHHHPRWVIGISG